MQIPRARRVVVRAVHENVAELVDLRMQRLVVLLEDWARWCRCYGEHIGYPRRSAGLVSGGAVVASDHVYEAADASCMCAVEAAIDDLAPVPRAAVLRSQGLCAVFRFTERMPYEMALEMAHEDLLRALVRRGVL